MKDEATYQAERVKLNHMLMDVPQLNESASLL